MHYLYSQGLKSFTKGQKFYWGSLYGSAAALAIIEFVKIEKRVVLVLAPDIASCNSFYKSLNFYNDKLDILIFDNLEVLAYDYFSPHPDITSNRLKTLFKLQNLGNAIVITTLETVLQYLCPSEFVAKYSFSLSVGSFINTELFSEKLIKIGYKKVNTVVGHGEFTIKGSLIDIYSMGAETPYRIDLFDEEVDSIRNFDIVTQRSITDFNEILLLPAREFSTGIDSIKTFKNNYAEAFGNTSDFICNEVVAQMRLPGGIEFYSPLFFTSRVVTLFEHLPQNTIVATYSNFSSLVDTTYQAIIKRYQHAALNLKRPPLAVDKVFISKNKFFAIIKQKQQIIISKVKLKPDITGLNFLSYLPPPVEIRAQSDNPLVKFLNFINKFVGKILVVCESLGRQNILIDLLKKYDIMLNNVNSYQQFISSNTKICTTIANLSDGLLVCGMAIITESNLFGSNIVKQKRRRRAKHKDFDEAVKNLVEIKKGDPIVHENYGVGRYLGLETYYFDGIPQDLLSIKYAGDTKLMVPMDSLNIISRYAGVDASNAPLHRLGSGQWAKAKKKACEALNDIAAELLEIYAKRQSQIGFAFPKPSDAYNSFVNSFEFEETKDQLKTMDEVLADMLADKPMDRLVCGDVGFGKTEIAMRAAFLALEASKQVAILTPTTLLANQHYQTFIDRFINYPANIEVISRFQNASSQKKIKASLLNGKTDIIIGTHRLIQNDIKYKNLGLIVIDEEHRFGVGQKELLKKLRGQSDILTMTATPIPRTLNMALGSLKELSIIATPPAGRSAIKTFVDEWSDDIIKEACARELHRGGQIFFLHNDIDSIDNMAENLQNIISNAHIRIAHGRMPSKELEHIMRDFYNGRFQILVCTTIIETGIHIPNANTIIINNAQNFGLAQLHQLRGRVGRSHHLAYAYLVIKPYYSLSSDAKKRLQAIESLKELGAGFMLANHDLEIRGAGNLLGNKQSGRINEIGFNLYNKLLKRTVEAMRLGGTINFNEPVNSEIQISSGISNVIPETYIADIHERLVFYKCIANSSSDDELKDLQIELIDRFGLLPDSTKNLFAVSKLRFFCKKISVNKINIYDDRAVVCFNNTTIADPMKIINLIKKKPQKYKLKKQNKLTITENMPSDIKRIEIVQNLLKTLVK